jgi:hypothetical protein
LSIAITASTGIASVNIGGCTVHSWAGIGLGQEEAKNLAGKFLGQPKFEPVKKRWRRVETLVIDERSFTSVAPLCLNLNLKYVSVSMIDGELFDKLVGRQLKLVIDI